MAQTAEVRWQWTADRYREAVRTGLIDQSVRYELIDGQLIEMPAQNPPHAQIIRNINQAAVLALQGTDWTVSVQSPLWLSETSNPEPDLAVVRGAFGMTHPRVSDTALVIEVSDSSRDRDMGEKRDLYAASGVREYWVVSIEERTVYVHQASDGYERPARWAHVSEERAPHEVPDLRLTLATIFAHV